MEKQKINLKEYNGNLINKAEVKTGIITLIYNLKKKSVYLAEITNKTENEVAFTVVGCYTKNIGKRRTKF